MSNFRRMLMSNLAENNDVIYQKDFYSTTTETMGLDTGIKLFEEIKPFTITIDSMENLDNLDNTNGHVNSLISSENNAYGLKGFSVMWQYSDLYMYFHGSRLIAISNNAVRRPTKPNLKFVIAFDGVETWTLGVHSSYQNYQTVKTVTYAPMRTTYNLIIGYNGISGTYPYDVDIKGVKVYNRCFSTDEINEYISVY